MAILGRHNETNWPESLASLDEERFFEETLAPFIANSINPGAKKRDINDVPLEREVFKEAGNLGLLAWITPIERGGLGGNAASLARLLGRIGYECDEPAFPSLLSMYADLARTMATCNSDDILERYARPALRGDCLLTFAYTEQGDSYSFQTIAEECDGGYLLSGHKVAQTGGAIADGYVVYAKGPTGHVQLFLVDRNMPGVTVKRVQTVGFRAAGMTSLTLDEVKVPKSHQLVSIDGHGHVQRFLGARRVYACAAWPGFMHRMFGVMVGYLRTRIRSGRPLAHNETVQAHLGELFVHCQTAEAVLADALGYMEQHGDDGPIFDAKLTATKYILAEHGLAFCQLTMRLLGWPGFTVELPFQRYLRDFQGALSGQTPQEVIKILLGNDAVAQFELRQHRRRSAAMKKVKG